MTPAETIDRLEELVSDAKDKADDGGALLLNSDYIATIESALVALRESQSAREQAAREAAGVCKKISADAWHEFKTSPQSNVRANPYTEGQSDGADSCESAILKHFNLEAK